MLIGLSIQSIKNNYKGLQRITVLSIPCTFENKISLKEIFMK